LEWKAGDGLLHLGFVALKRPNGTHWTCDKRLVSGMDFGVADGLSIDRGKVIILGKRGRCQLPAGITVNAGGIYEEVIPDVVG
jgi:hypothetical protein